jgi:hypothetical protein
VDDPAGGEQRRRNRLADLAALVECSERRENHASTSIFVRRWILQHNLFGAAGSSAEARQCRERLHRYASLHPAIGAVDSNVHRLHRSSAKMTDSSGERDRPPIRGAASVPQHPVGDPAEEVEAIAHVLRSVREERLNGGADLEELREVGRELEFRHARLVRSLDAERGGGVSDPRSNIAPDDPSAEFRLWTLFPPLLGRPDRVVLPIGR